MSSNRVVDLRQGKRAAEPVRRVTFAPKPKRQSPLKTKRRRVRAVITAIGCVALLGLAYAVHLGSYLPQFTFQSATIKGTVVLSASDVQIFTENYFSEHNKGYISANNILVFSPPVLEQAIADKFRRIKEVHVAPDAYFSNELTITVSERASFARWCIPAVTTEDTSKCFALDENGYVFAPVDSQATSTFTTAYVFMGPLATSTNSYATLLPIGGTYATGHFPAVISLLDSLGQSGFIGSTITSENGQDIQVALQQGFFLKASYGADPNQIARDLRLVLSSDALKDKNDKIEYIDLRFGNRVYYKLRGEAQSE